MGKSTCGSGDTGKKLNATAPARATATVSSVVATGRRMNGDERLIVCSAGYAAIAGVLARIPLHAGREPVKENVNHGSRVEREDLAEDKPADHGDAERPAQFRSDAATECQRQAAARRAAIVVIMMGRKRSRQA